VRVAAIRLVVGELPFEVECQSFMLWQEVVESVISAVADDADELSLLDLFLSHSYILRLAPEQAGIDAEHGPEIVALGLSVPAIVKEGPEREPALVEGVDCEHWIAFGFRPDWGSSAAEHTDRTRGAAKAAPIFAYLFHYSSSEPPAIFCAGIPALELGDNLLHR
jgi:hypothetical protein